MDLKSKTLELIYKELESVDHRNIFNCTMKPYYDIYVKTSSNIDEIKESKYEVLKYILKFDDGAPFIYIDYHKDISESGIEFYKRSWLKRYYTQYYDVKISTVISIGDNVIKLTDDESSELLNATKTAYEKHINLRLEMENKRIYEKLDSRIKKSNIKYI